MSETATQPIAPAWKAFSKAYHAHHFACPTCIAAGLGISQRCDIGSPLWTAYQENAS